MELSDLTDERIDGMEIWELESALDGFGGMSCWAAARNLTEAHIMENRLAEMGLAERYAEALFKVVSRSGPDARYSYAQPFDLIHASPRDRCRAALRAIRDAKIKENTE